ncbi:MAG: DNA primase catalytic subunit PriS [Archaeoglobaceae archaeon]
MEEKQYLIKKFSEFYSKHRIDLPREFKKREFAFVPFESIPEFVMRRHVSFESEEEFRGYVAKNVPAHVYYSSAYYENPGEEKMEKKGWIGADLIFDIDGDHLPIKTKNIASLLERTKIEVKKLIKLLKTDFGVKEVEIFFSGGRGYHVHVLDEDFRYLEAPERREIIDYLTLNNPRLFGNFPESNAEIRVKRYLSKKGIPERNWKKEKFIKSAIDALRVYIDAPVTADVKRLIRMPGTLHGKSGLRVTKVEDIETFDPFRDAIAFGEEKVRVRILKKVKMKMGGYEFNFSPGDSAEIPEFSAIYLICRGLAKI